MQPAEGTHILFLDNDGILFSEPAQKLFHLNTMATFIWCLLEEGKERPAIVTNLQSTFALSKFDATRYLEQTQGLFQTLGVLKGFEPAPTIEEATTTETPALMAYGDDSFITERHYRLLSSHIRMRFSHSEQLSYIEPILSHLLENKPSTATVNLDIVQENSGRIVLCRNQLPVLSCSELLRLAPLVKSLVWQTAVCAHDFFLDIHAGVVGDGEYCYLLPAASGSGKSTLTAALISHGFEYFSDEVALLQGNDLLVQPVPLAICIKDTGAAALSHFFPQLSGQNLHLRGDGKRVLYMPPPIQALPPAETLRPVGAIFFPYYAPDQQTKLESIPAIEALLSLLQECLIVDTHLNKKKVSSLLDWIERTPCYRLTISNLNNAVKLIKSISSELLQSHGNNH